MFPVSTQTSLDEIEDAGNAEFGGEFLGPHRSFLSRRASSPIAARRRHHEIWRAGARKTLFGYLTRNGGRHQLRATPGPLRQYHASRDTLVRDVLWFRLWRL